MSLCKGRAARYLATGRDIKGRLRVFAGAAAAKGSTQGGAQSGGRHAAAGLLQRGLARIGGGHRRVLAAIDGAAERRLLRGWPLADDALETDDGRQLP